jgi:hypothetical protein
MYAFSQDDDATDEDETIPPHTDEDVISLIVEDRLWFDDSALVAEALDSLNKLVYSNTNDAFEDNRKAAVLQGVPLAIVQAMRQNEDSLEVQSCACKVLTNIALCKLDHARRDIIESGGVKACIRALARFRASPCMQLAGCNMIGNLWLSPDVRKAVADAEALTAVFNAMNDHKSSLCIQRKGCYALVALLRGESSWAEAAVNIGCLDAVIDAIGKHRYDAEVQQHGFQFLCALAKSHDDYRNRIIDAKGLIAVAEAQRIHKDNTAVVRAAENANACLSSAV